MSLLHLAVFCWLIFATLVQTVGVVAQLLSNKRVGYTLLIAMIFTLSHVWILAVLAHEGFFAS